MEDERAYKNVVVLTEGKKLHERSRGVWGGYY
jgi:hypothetical protein